MEIWTFHTCNGVSQYKSRGDKQLTWEKQNRLFLRCPPAARISTWNSKNIFVSVGHESISTETFTNINILTFPPQKQTNKKDTMWINHRSFWEKIFTFLMKVRNYFIIFISGKQKPRVYLIMIASCIVLIWCLTQFSNLLQWHYLISFFKSV